MRVLAVAALALALTACGGAAQPTAAELRNCAVQIYFAPDATQAQERSVGAKLRNDSRVRQISFTSKALALAKMKKEFPDLFKQNLPDSPLPDSFTVVPVELPVSALGSSLRQRQWPGVQVVQWPGSTGVLRNGCSA